MNKALIEKRNALMEKIEAVLTVAQTETRAFTTEELEKVNGYKAEVEQIDATIKANEEARQLVQSKTPVVKAPKVPEVRSLVEEVRELDADANKEVEIGTREMRNKAHTLSSDATGTGNSATEGIAKMTFADYILDKLTYISPLYGAVRKERFGLSKHQIPVQANKLGKFVPMKELADYSKQVASFAPINLEAHKFGTLVTFSNEVLEDTGYNMEAELLRQLTDSYGITLDEMLVKGESTMGVEGLEAFTTEDGAKEVAQATAGTMTPADLLAVYFALPVRYRNQATWVISDDMARQLSEMKFEDGRPVLMTSFNGSPVSPASTILGRPVIVNEHVATEGKTIFFGDLQRALIVGERKTLTLQKSVEYGFIRDEVAIKGNMRMDIKKGLGEAVAYLATSAPARKAK